MQHLGLACSLKRRPEFVVVAKLDGIRRKLLAHSFETEEAWIALRAQLYQLLQIMDERELDFVRRHVSFEALFRSLLRMETSSV